MKQEHGQLKRSIEGLRGIQHWRDEGTQLEKVGRRARRAGGSSAAAQQG